MAKINTLNYQTVAAWNGSQDLFVVEQPDGTKVATPAQIKQYVLGNSIDDIYSVMGQMGAKNLLVPKWTETQTTENGVTYTFNVDGTIIMNTDASGATADTNCNLKNVQASTDNIYPAGTYKLSGCPSGGSGTTYRTWARAYRPGDSSSPLTGNLYDEGNGVTFTVNETFQLAINLTVRKNYVCNNLTWKPMLRYASDTDNTYQPYAKTNKELTEVIGDLSQTGLTGDSVAEQLGTAKNQIATKINKTAIQMRKAVFPSAAVGVQTVTVTFPTAFAHTPQVMVSWDDNQALPTFFKYPLHITNITTTGFTVQAERLNASDNWWFRYIAVDNQ